jgi:hypothetical protein
MFTALLKFSYGIKNLIKQYFAFGIKVLTHQKKTPPHFENAQNAQKKNQKSASEPQKSKKIEFRHLKMS